MFLEKCKVEKCEKNLEKMSLPSKSFQNIITKEDQIGFIFGKPLEVLPNGFGKFSEVDVVRHYIFKYDEIRGSSYHVKKKLKLNILNSVIDSFISACQSQGFVTQERGVIRERIKKIIAKADNLIENGSACKNKSNENFVEKTRNEFANYCQIVQQLPNNLFPTPKSTAKKRKVEILVSLYSTYIANIDFKKKKKTIFICLGAFFTDTVLYGYLD